MARDARATAPLINCNGRCNRSPPSLLVMFGVWKAEMQKIVAVNPAARDERHGHRDGHFVVVARPAAVEIERDVTKRFA